MYRIELSPGPSPVPGYHRVGYVHEPAGSGVLYRSDDSTHFIRVTSDNAYPLDTGQVAHAIWGDHKVGKTRSDRSVLTRIDNELHALAVQLGNGNFSEGVRVALRSLKNDATC